MIQQLQKADLLMARARNRITAYLENKDNKIGNDDILMIIFCYHHHHHYHYYYHHYHIITIIIIIIIIIIAIDMKFEQLKREFFQPPTPENREREQILSSYKNILFLYIQGKMAMMMMRIRIRIRMMALVRLS